MELILGGRVTGKTDMLKERIRAYQASNEPFLIVVPNMQMAQQFVREFGKERVFTISQVVQNRIAGMPRSMPVFVDNLDHMLHQLFGVHRPEIATMTLEAPCVILPHERGYELREH